MQQATTQNAVVLAWPASTDNVGVVGYGVYRDLTQIASPADPTVTLSGLACGSSTPYKVDAVDAAGNRSALGTAYVQTAACADSQPPTAPTNLAVMAKTTSSLSLGWSPSSDNVGVAGYHVSAGGSPVATVTQPGATLTGLACGTAYSISVDAFDTAGNRSTLVVDEGLDGRVRRAITAPAGRYDAALRTHRARGLQHLADAVSP